VTMPQDPQAFNEIACKKHHPKLDIHPDYSYLLVGGLGGIGRSIARSLALNGAKHLIFISRSGRSSKNEHLRSSDAPLKYSQDQLRIWTW
jgi:shikimate 5-dehydrogenase